MAHEVLWTMKIYHASGFSSWAIAVRRGSYQSLFLLNSGRFSLENKENSVLNFSLKKTLNRYGTSSLPSFWAGTRVGVFLRVLIRDFQRFSAFRAQGAQETCVTKGPFAMHAGGRGNLSGPGVPFFCETQRTTPHWKYHSIVIYYA